MGLKARATASLSPELLERFRQTGIRLDRAGRFWHDGEQITHRGLRRGLLGWLDIRPSDGRSILRLDEKRYAYIDVEDAHLLATSLEWRGDRAFLRLNDETEEELNYSALEIGPGFAMYSKARGGILTVRLTTPAYYALARNVIERGGGFELAAAGRRFRIGDRNR